ncbi:MAG: alcohol dehydrogenase catalytic domain-containing protein [Alphaproteobacteria bacterium]|nr:alcohol dehydrogenase catalytic domain-containing protein [Alphaproteobacteria bacterium]
MTDTSELWCREPADPVELEVRVGPAPSPGDGEALVRVMATTVNPIDLRRAKGYGRRFLRLVGAGKYPQILGNDFAGVIAAVGANVRDLHSGDRVFGLVPTGKGGAHSSYVCVDARLIRCYDGAMTDEALATLPYCFTTVGQALRGAGITKSNAKGLQVLVHGASGGLGQLSLQLLNRWGALVTAVCSTPDAALCRELGAAAIWDRRRQKLDALPACFDAGLNFANWQDEEILLSRLRKGALGYATTVHPFLGNFDRFGLIRGGWRNYRDFARMRALAAEKTATYRWVIFRPQTEALDELQQLLAADAVKLTVGMTASFAEARRAFEHVANSGTGRVVLLP